MKKMRRLYRIGALAGAILLPISAVLAAGIPEASAAVAPTEQSAVAPTEQFCYISNGSYACLNAWGGGPWVKVYTGGFNTKNNDFALVVTNNGNYEIKFTGGGPWSGKCVGDAYNKSGNPETSLDPCGGGGTSAGWGTQFEQDPSACPVDEIAFQNIHWGGLFIEPPIPWANGDNWYLYGPPYCFSGG